MHYLGIPIFGHCLRRADYIELETSICTCLDGWQSRTLSIMGRVTLTRLVLSAIPVFLLSDIIVPRATLSRLEQLFRNFLWGSYQGRAGAHLLTWNMVCLPIREWGFGIQSLYIR